MVSDNRLRKWISIFFLFYLPYLSLLDLTRILFPCLYKNDIICPDKLYHLSKQENKNSIFKKGIYPKSKKRLSAHPDRIYLFDGVNNYEVLLNKMKFTDSEKIDYLLLEIDCSIDKLFLHTDPNYRLGYFTYDNINPKNILKENL